MGKRKMPIADRHMLSDWEKDQAKHVCQSKNEQQKLPAKARAKAHLSKFKRIATERAVLPKPIERVLDSLGVLAAWQHTQCTANKGNKGNGNARHCNSRRNQEDSPARPCHEMPVPHRDLGPILQKHGFGEIKKDRRRPLAHLNRDR